MSDSELPLVRVEEQGAIAAITLNRPRAGNSLSMELVAALRAVLTELESRSDIKVLVLAGAGGRIFCAGHDLNEFVGEPDEAWLRQDFEGLGALMQQIQAQPQIVIAKVEGVATAAGCELVAAADLAIASSVARFAVPGINIGFWCHTPQIQLSRTVGRKQAMHMLVTGKLFPADHALAIGLVNAVVPPEQLDAEVDELAREIAAKSATVLALGKRAFYRQLGRDIPEAYACAASDAIANLRLEDAGEGIAAFLEKRPPRWRDGR